LEDFLPSACVRILFFRQLTSKRYRNFRRATKTYSDVEMHNFKWLLSSPITGAHISQDLFIATRPARDDRYICFLLWATPEGPSCRDKRVQARVLGTNQATSIGRDQTLPRQKGTRVGRRRLATVIGAIQIRRIHYQRSCSRESCPLTIAKATLKDPLYREARLTATLAESNEPPHLSVGSTLLPLVCENSCRRFIFETLCGEASTKHG
jgi:hypothetical protein